MRGIELVGAKTSHLVLAVTFLPGNFWNPEFTKNSMSSIILYSILTSVVISRLSYFRLAEIRPKGESPFYLQHSWWSPNGTSNFILLTQRLSLLFSVLLWSCGNIPVPLSWWMLHVLLKLYPCNCDWKPEWSQLPMSLSYGCLMLC